MKRSFNFRQSVGLLGQDIRAHRKVATYTGQHNHRINSNIHALSGIRTHDTSVRASEDIPGNKTAQTRIKYINAT
jgi:hypothetical protein